MLTLTCQPPRESAASTCQFPPTEPVRRAQSPSREGARANPTAMSCTCWSAPTVAGFRTSRAGDPSASSSSQHQPCPRHPLLEARSTSSRLTSVQTARPRCMPCTSSNTRSLRPRHDDTAHGFTGWRWLSTPSTLRCTRNSPPPTARSACSTRSRSATPATSHGSEQIQQELLDLTIAVASLREQIEPDPTIEIDPADIRDRLSAVTTRFREHQAREADLVYEAIGRDLDES